MVASVGTTQSTIFLPPELIAFDELNPNVKQKLPGMHHGISNGRLDGPVRIML